jgi:ubiquinone/menaquinone biosynthesis C-methylase UbiE
MPAMSSIERAFCRSSPWRGFSSRVLVPWVLGGRTLTGDTLEIGTGSGAMASVLLERFPSMRLRGTDVDPAMVESARARLAPFGARVTVEQADATSLPFPTGRFDAVVSFIMLHHVIDWERALGEAARVLRPGGVLFGYDLVESWPAELLHRLDGSPHRLATTDAIHARLSELGLQDVHTDTSLAGLVTRFGATTPIVEPKNTRAPLPTDTRSPT